MHANLIEGFWELTLALPGDNPWRNDPRHHAGQVHAGQEGTDTETIQGRKAVVENLMSLQPEDELLFLSSSRIAYILHTSTTFYPSGVSLVGNHHTHPAHTLVLPQLFPEIGLGSIV